MNNNNHNEDTEKLLISKPYLETINNFLRDNKYGIISLIIQKGKIVGCDVTEKKRESI